MNEQEAIPQWEQKVQETAAALAYPPTPDVAGGVQRRLTTSRPQPARRRLAWAVALVVLLLAGLLAVPQVRAAVWRIFRIGAVTIFEGDVSETAVPATATPLNETGLSPVTPESANDTVFRLAGETTLAQAQADVDFPLKLPVYPADVGLPDAVYRQQINFRGDGDAVIMVWFGPKAKAPEQAQLVLYQIQADAYLTKTAQTVAETAVHDQSAVWVEGPHWVQLQNGDYETWLAVAGNVLVWTEGDVTYRLESMASRDEAVRMAESLTAVPEE